MANTEAMDEDMEVDEREFYLNHVILPRYLPAEKQGFVKQLKLMNEMVQTIIETPCMPRETIHLFEQFKRLHNDTKIENLNQELKSQIRSLRSGKTFAMFVRRQNCTLLVQKQQNSVILATFRGDMKSTDVYSHDSDIEYHYPSNAIQVKSSNLLQNDHFIEQLCVLYANSPKESNNREYVTKWLMTMLADADSKTASPDDCPIITKKIRHELIGESKQKYFRRSRVYMSTKVLLQHSLTMQLGAELGKFVYKIVMMKFFNELCAPYTDRGRVEFNIELLSQMSAKMARRIEKLEDAQPDQLTDNYLQFCNNTIKQSKKVIETIRHKIDVQIRKIQKIDENRSIKPMKRLDFETAVQQEIPVLNRYLAERIANVGDDGNGDANLIDCEVKSYRRYFSGADWPPTVETIAEINAKADGANNKEHDGGLERRLFWIDFENRVLYTNDLNDKSPEFLREWALEYLKYAEQMYDDNRLLKSRMLLVYLKLIEVLDRRLCTNTQFPLLQSHKSCVNPKIIDALLLPHRIDMQIAADLEQYFNERNTNARDPGLIDERRVMDGSFSVKYARRSQSMKAICKRILERDAENVEQKRLEWEEHQRRVNELREEIKRMEPCQMFHGTRICNAHICARCKKDQEIQNVKIEVYEHLLPDKEYEQLAIAFELQIPRAIACLRDILHGFVKLFGGTVERLSFKNWIDRDEIRELVPFLSTNGTNQSVHLGSTVHTTPKRSHVDQLFETFVVSNTSNCLFYADQKPMPPPIADESIKNVCKPFKLEDEYRVLQWTLNGTEHTENEVLVQQSKCPESLPISEYKNFGTLRADGNRLQLRKLYAMIETEALSFKEESVLSLVMQTLWECGIKGDTTSNDQYGIRESHIDFLNEAFCSKLLEALDTYTTRQEMNWMHPFKLLMVTLTAVRIYEMNNNPCNYILNDKVMDLLLKVRAIIYVWIERIERAIHEIKNADEKSERQLRLKLIYVAAIGALTFSIHPKHNHFEMILQTQYLDPQTAPQQWLHFVITLNSNLQIYSRNEQHLPSNLRMFLRMIERIGIDLEPKMKELIIDDRRKIYELVRVQWPRSNYGEFQSADFHPEFSEILTVISIVDDTRQMVTIDIITGSFLVNGLPLSRLPSYILESEVYQCFFGDFAFEVQPENQQSFSTIKKYNDCLYEFKKVNDDIIIIERNDNGTERELIHHEKLKGDLPNLLIKNYSHWWDKQQNCLEFRKRSTGSQRHFSKEVQIDYRLNLDSNRLIHLKTNRPLLDIKSGIYQKLVTQLQRLEHPNFMHIFMEKKHIATIELLRMKLKFKLDCSNPTSADQLFQLESNEFSGMHVSCKQNIGTLYGLNHGLILESSEQSAKARTKILLIPNGKVRSRCVRIRQHVSVDIDTKDGVRNPPFYKYEIDTFCQQLKSSDCSHASWFYLAYLHAVTSHGEIDPFTGLTGTERSLQILQSSFAWSASPYDPEALEMLKDIARLSPIRKLTEQHIQNVLWPSSILPHSAQDSFVFVVKKLYEDSQRLHGLYSKEPSAHELNLKTDLKYNERDYHRCLQLQPNMRVNAEFIKPKELRTSLPESIGVSFSKKTQTVAYLFHTHRYEAPKEKNFLKTFLTYKRKIFLKGLQTDYAKTVTQLLNHEECAEFPHLWINLYNIARKRKCSREEFGLVLSLLAHRDEEMDPILALQAVAHNPEKFHNIKPPKIVEYKLSDGIYTDEKASKILRKYFSPNNPNLTETIMTTIIDELVSQILQNWPCQSVKFCKKPRFRQYDRDYKYDAANTEINKNLESWYKRHRLEQFIKDVEARLKTLAPCNTSNVPEYDPFVTPTAENWPKFSMDVEKKISDHLMDPKFVEIKEEAQNIWNAEDNDMVWRSADVWWTQIEQIFQPSESMHLIQAGLFPRIVPSLLLPKILAATENTDDDSLKALIGAWGLAIAREQQTTRIEIYSNRPECQPALNSELQNEAHTNWRPCDRPEWLVFEIEQNLTIREIQIKVAEQMMNPPRPNQNANDDTKHSVMQLNMGEGKTSVIIPMLAAALANGDQVCQITVLKALLTTNLKALRQYLGGMLNQRVYTFPCRRDMAITQHIEEIQEIFEECKAKRGVILTQPDYRLSFQLKLYESIQKGDNAKSKQYMDTHRWINANVRNILDESDAILQPNYQLIYTVGNELPLDGGDQRWTICQAVLRRLPYHMKRFHQKWFKANEAAKANGEPPIAAQIEYDDKYVAHGHVYGAPNVDERADVFTPCRILDDAIFDQLKVFLANDFVEGRLEIPNFLELNTSGKNHLKSLLTERNIDAQSFDFVVRQFPVNSKEHNTIMILSGLLRFEVLKLALTKRWRVNYGVDPKGQRKMAIPFKFKDVPSEQSEFGHPDVAICLTQLSYYYSGLTDAELYQLFTILESKENASAIYESWFQTQTGAISWKLVDSTIATYSGINLDDPNQRDHLLFPLLRHNMMAIDFYLSNVVYIHEAKIFEKKLMCTAWDLCSDQLQLPVTGFSGTNDTKTILPLPIVQNDLPELEGTNEEMRKTLLNSVDAENAAYRRLQANISGKQIIEELSARNIPVLLDSGALMLELANKEVAMEWLKLVDENRFDAAVYFDSNDILQTIDRNDIVTEFDCSVYRDNLSRCIVYLDDVHTRGTDLKFPLNWTACVTLCGDITRDKVVQSCARMRQLARSQKICFWASYEADIRLRKFCNLPNDNRVTNEHVVQFITHNSRDFEILNMVPWTTAALNYTKKLIGHKLYESSNDPEAMQKLYGICVDNEFVKLTDMYGDKKQSLLTQIAYLKFSYLAMNQIQSADFTIITFVHYIQRKVAEKLQKEAPYVCRFSHALDEELQKELEQEQEFEEERHDERSFNIKAAKPAIHETIKSLVENGVTDDSIDGMTTNGLLYSIGDSLSNTRMHEFCQKNRNAWASHLYVSKDFKTVIEGTATVYDKYLRRVMWVVRIKHNRGKDILVLISSFECNELLPILRTSPYATLFMYRPRLSELHDNLLNESCLHVTGQPASAVNFIDLDDEVQISMYAGSMYFKSEAEMNAYCAFMGLIPRPRSTRDLQQAYDEGKIVSKGFVPKSFRRYLPDIGTCVGRCKFEESPVDFAIELIEARHQSLQKESHVASILQRGKKVEFERNEIKQEPSANDDDNYDNDDDL